MFIIIEVKVVPQSSVGKVILNNNNQIVVYLKSLPIEGRANKELIKVLSEKLKTTQRDIEIISGLSNKYKKLKIYGLLTMDDLFNKLGFEKQSKII